MLVQADIRKIPFEKLGYDVVICLGGLQHTPNPEESINSIDLEGVNSPNRGWFKLSLGGELNPYYKIKI